MHDPISLRFDGHLVAETCIATCPPGLDRAKNAPAPLPRMTVGNNRTVYFPGSGLRGTLRRRSVDLIRSTLSTDGVSPFSLDDHYYLVLGGVKGDDKEDKADILNSDLRRRSNPVLGLFGAGDPWQSGRLYVSHAVPAPGVEIEPVRGARVDDFARSGDNLRLLTPDEQQTWLNVAKLNNQKSARIKEQEANEKKIKSNKTSADEKKALEKRNEALDAEIKELTAQSRYTNSINRPLDGYEVIPQGAQMSQSLFLSFGNLNEVGLLMGAIRFWALDPWIGAHKAHGCGIVSGSWSVSMRVGHERSYKPLGEVTMRAFEDVKGPDMLLEAEAEFMKALQENGQFDFKYRSKAA